VVGAVVRQVQNPCHDDHRRDADRYVQVEHPAPSGHPQDLVLACEEAAQDRADDAGGAEHREEVALVPGALAGRHDVADDGQGQRHQAACADALDGAERGQLVHVLGQTAEHRADDEDGDREQEEGPPAVDVGELAV
jgi:hypothetical protein